MKGAISPTAKEKEILVMAQRRMFSIALIDNDKFMELPLSAQAVYFHLGLRADDDGFVGNPKSTLRMIGGTKEDFTALQKAGLVREFESGVVLIVNWSEHNSIRKDRYRPTVFRKEKSEASDVFTACEEDETEAVTDGCTDADNCDAQDRLGKDRLGKDRLGKDRLGEDRSGEDRSGEDSLGEDSSDKDSSEKKRTDKVSTHKESTSKATAGEQSAEEKSKAKASKTEVKEEQQSTEHSRQGKIVTDGCVCDDKCSEIFSLYNRICTALPQAKVLSEDRQAQISLLLRKYTAEQVEEAFYITQHSPFLTGHGKGGWRASFDWLIKEENIQRVLEGCFDKPKPTFVDTDRSYNIEEYEKYSMFD